MSTTLAPCPERAVLVNFLVGQLSEKDAASLEQHLSECAACGDTVRALDVEDTLLKLVRSANAVPPQSELPQDLLIKLNELPVAAEESAADGARVIPSVVERAEEVLRLLHPPQQADEIGRLGGYRVLKLLGAGGMGVVFQAQDEQLQRLVALKVLRPSLGAGARERFLREARAAAAIDHENVITIYHVGEDGPLAFLAMQWLDGETLEERLKREQKLPPDETLEFGKQIAQGLAAAHARKLIHRDVKPANIWLEADRRRVKILDFGLAFVYDEETHLTETGIIGGTPAYMSPEQARGERVDARSDLFSLGAVLYRLCTGALPFPAANVLATLRAIQHDQPAPLRSTSAEVPKSLAELVMHLLEKEPSRRLESALAVVEAVERIQRGEQHVRPAPRKLHLRQAVGVAIALLVAALSFAAAPQVIRIVTNQGQLVIKSDDPNVQVEVRGEIVRIIDLRSKRTLDLKAGSYEIKLTEGAEGLSLSTDHFTLRRGGKAVVEVLRELETADAPGVQPQKAARGEPKFDGKTFSQWLAELETERKPERLAEAMRALGALANEEQSGEAIPGILRLMRKYGGSKIRGSGPHDKLIDAAAAALWLLPHETTVRAIIDELKNGNEQSRWFLYWSLARPGREQQHEAFEGELKKRSKEILSVVLALSRGESPGTRDWAFNYLRHFCQTFQIDPASVEGLVRRLQEELSSKDLDRILLIAPLLVKAAPDTQGLVAALVHVLSSDFYDFYNPSPRQFNAVRLLGDLGPRAAPATKELARRLEQALARKLPFPLSPRFDVTQDIRLEIAKVLGNIGPAAKEALPVLEKAAGQRTTERFVEAAKAAIAKIKTDSKSQK